MTETPIGTATFQRATKSDWHELVEIALRGKNYGSLRTLSEDGVEIEPAYDSSSVLQHIDGRPSGAPWTVVQRLDTPESIRFDRILGADLAGGARGIEVLFSGGASACRTGFGLETADKKLVAALSDGNIRHLRLDGGELTYQRYWSFAAVKVDELILSYDPLAHAAALGGFERPLREIETDIVQASNELSDAGQRGASVVADGRIWAAGGASEAQEIAGILGAIAHYARLLIRAEFPPRQALDAIGIIADAGPSLILTTAKLRALRLTHARLVEAFDLAPLPTQIHAETSWRTMTRHEAHTNILRTTTAALAAGISGANSLTVLPFTCALGLPDQFARRVARNIQNILLEEAGVARVGDPAAGSGAIETLTKDIAESAWDRFTNIEAGGGLLAMLRSGSFQRDIAKTRMSRANRIASREIAITGISEFPNLEPTAYSVLSQRPTEISGSAKKVEAFEPLTASRLAEPFEALRDRATALSEAGNPPSIFLVGLGSLVEIAEASRAASNFFAVGGIRSIEATDDSTLLEAVQEFAKSDATCVCVVGAKERLTQDAAAIASAMKEAGAARAYVLGAPVAAGEIDAILDETVDVTTILSEVLAQASKATV